MLLRGRPRAGEVLASETLGDAWPLACARRSATAAGWSAATERASVLDLLEEAGVTPLPPYIHEDLDDPERYQTTYARVVGLRRGARPPACTSRRSSTRPWPPPA